MSTGRPNGRPPKPVSERLGHRSKKENHEQELNIVFDIPSCPFKKLTQQEQTLWELLWTAGKNYLKPERDIFVVFNILTVWVDFIKENNQLRREGFIIEVTTGNGFTTNKRNERQLVVKDLQQQLNTLFSTLGFSPADAARLQLENDSDEKVEALRELLTQKRGV